jgi:PhnB protein
LGKGGAKPLRRPPRTAAELIVERADADKEHMGLTTWETAPHGKIIKTDVTANETAIQTPEISACRGKRGVRRVRGAIVPVVAEVYRRPRRVDGHAAQSKQEILRADLRAERQAVRQPKMRAAEPPHETSFAGTPGTDFLRQASEAIDFYEKVFHGTNKRVMHWGDAPTNTNYPVDAMKKEWVLHGEINLCGTNFSISDCDQVFQTTHFMSLMARLDTPEEIQLIDEEDYR